MLIDWDKLAYPYLDPETPVLDAVLQRANAWLAAPNATPALMPVASEIPVPSLFSLNSPQPTAASGAGDEGFGSCWMQRGVGESTPPRYARARDDETARAEPAHDHQGAASNTLILNLFRV